MEEAQGGRDPRSAWLDQKQDQEELGHTDEYRKRPQCGQDGTWGKSEDRHGGAWFQLDLGNSAVSVIFAGLVFELKVSDLQEASGTVISD